MNIQIVKYYDFLLYIYHCVFSLFGLYDKWKFTLKYEFNEEIAKLEEGSISVATKREN
jgi:hypothetical protein